MGLEAQQRGSYAQKKVVRNIASCRKLHDHPLMNVLHGAWIGPWMRRWMDDCSARMRGAHRFPGSWKPVWWMQPRLSSYVEPL